MPDLQHLDAELGDAVDEVKALHTGGEQALTPAELAIIPAAGHISPSDPRRADAFAAAIADFARRHTDT